jgi:hypothetical protein
VTYFHESAIDFQVILVAQRARFKKRVELQERGTYLQLPEF